jgi:uridine kinase
VQEVVVVRRITPDQAAGWVRARLAGRSGTRWVGVDGFGAAGKTTLAREIAAALPGAQLVGVDDFARADRPDWHRELFAATLLQPLLAGRAARYQRWDLLTDTGLDWVEVRPGTPLVVEGVSATDVRVPVPWDVVLWVEAAEEVRRARIAARDDPGLLVRWQREWWPCEEAYAAAQRPWQRADAIVAPSAGA